MGYTCQFYQFPQDQFHEKTSITLKQFYLCEYPEFAGLFCNGMTRIYESPLEYFVGNSLIGKGVEQ